MHRTVVHWSRMTKERTFSGSFTLSPPLSDAQRKVLDDFSDARHDNDWSNGRYSGCPGLWCDWIASSDGASLAWNGQEKFHRPAKWLEYLITHFFKLWRVTVNGEVTFTDEDAVHDEKIVVVDNVVQTRPIGRRT